MIRTQFNAIFCLLFSLSVRGWAAESEAIITDSLRLRLEQLQQQINAIQQQLAGQGALFGAGNPDDFLAARNGGVYLPQRPASSLPVTPDGIHTNSTGLLKKAELEISGFMDIVYSANLKNGNDNMVGIQQAEVDFTKAISERAGAALSVCYDDQFGIGAATFSYALIKTDVGDEIPAKAFQGWSISAGQFDVPFGLDYLKYASNARLSVTQPEIVNAVHGSWNDVGMTTELATRLGTVHAYAVQGFAANVWDSGEPIPADAVDDDERWAVVQPSMAGGMRFNCSPLPDVDAGFSAARGFDRHGRADWTMGGVHAQAGYHSYSIKGEALECRKAEQLRPFTVRGFYMEGLKDFGPMFLMGRISYVQGDPLQAGHFYGFCAGLQIVDGFECRLEYCTRHEDGRQAVRGQVVASF
jgi:hypothetical protein